MITPAELSFIRSGQETRIKQHTSWLGLLRCRQTWAFSAAKIFSDPAWYFYLFWLPKFLAQEHGLRGKAVVPYLTTAYVLCGIGSAFGGYVSSFVIKRGYTVNLARKGTMAVSAAIMPVVILAGKSRDPWTVALLMGVTLAAHQSWSTMVYTMGTDLFPSRAMASAAGIATALGSASTILFAEVAGRVLQHDPKLYLPLFIACGSMYTVALLLVQLLAPGLEPAEID